jgi:hypothetical protein
MNRIKKFIQGVIPKMNLKKNINDLIRRGDRLSLSRLLMFIGIGQVFIYTAVIMKRVVWLDDTLFVESLSSIVLLLGGIFTLLGGIYAWGSYLDGKKKAPPPPNSDPSQDP